MRYERMVPVIPTKVQIPRRAWIVAWFGYPVNRTVLVRDTGGRDACAWRFGARSGWQRWPTALIHIGTSRWCTNEPAGVHHAAIGLRRGGQGYVARVAQSARACARRAQDDGASFADRSNPIPLVTLVGNKALVRAIKREEGAGAGKRLRRSGRCLPYGRVGGVLGGGAGDGNRTHVSSLGSWGNSHYTTPAERMILQGFLRFRERGGVAVS